MPHTNVERLSWANPIAQKASQGNRSMRELIDQMRAGEIVIPPWQRGRVWSEEDKIAWVGNILSWGQRPPIWIRSVNVYQGKTLWRDQLVDGQQRMTSLLDWLDGKIPARLHDGRTIWCEDEDDKKMIYRQYMPVATLPVETTDVDVLQLYLVLNTAGVPHTEAELNKAREALAAALKAEGK